MRPYFSSEHKFCVSTDNFRPRNINFFETQIFPQINYTKCINRKHELQWFRGKLLNPINLNIRRFISSFFFKFFISSPHTSGRVIASFFLVLRGFACSSRNCYRWRTCATAYKLGYEGQWRTLQGQENGGIAFQGSYIYHKTMHFFFGRRSGIAKLSRCGSLEKVAARNRVSPRIERVAP